MSTFLSNLFNLHIGEDENKKILENVKSNISFTGANLWILACAIMVASVGLNVNSTAVIIGAMLISPLMGPIVASGFALGIYDFDLLKRALRNLLVATIVGLIVSALYFFISPFKEVQSELLARTSPNIYDILIAFFGGLVGVIAVTRVEKGNPIPGVAIATALMPPLCTAGYGLATGQIKFFLGAFFLYCINCVFICIATFAIVKYLKYPAKAQVDIKHQKQVKYGVTAIVLLMLLPSFYFAYNLFKQQQFSQSVNVFVDKEFAEKGNTIVYKKTYYNSNPRKIELAFLSRQFSKEDLDGYNTKLKEYGFSNTILTIKQSNNLQNLKNDILNEVSKAEIFSNEKDNRIVELENKIAADSFNNKQIFKEAKALFPVINALSVSKHTFYFAKDSMAINTVLLYKAGKELNETDKEKFLNWLKEKLSKDSIKVIYEK
ncbi:MAG: TIGR00341 family protein [Ferruginibacter sp.]